MTNPPDSPPRDVGYNSSKAIMSGVTWAVLMRFSMRFIGLFSTLILARLLTPDDFGVVALGTLVAHFLFEMTEFGSSMLLIRSREIDRQRCDTAWTITLLQALVTAAVLAILAVPASLYFDEPRVIEVMYVLAASSFVAGFENIGPVLARRDLKFALDFRFNLYKKCLVFVATVASALIFRSYWALVIGLLSGNIAGVLLSFLLFEHRPRWCLKYAGEYLRFGLAIIPLRLATTLREMIPAFLVAGVGHTSTMGSYRVARDLANLFTSEIVTPMGRGLLPNYVRLADQPEELSRVYRGVLGMVIFVCMPVAVGVASVASDLTLVLLGPQWDVVRTLLGYLAIGAAGFAVSQAMVNQILVATGRERAAAVLAWIRLAITVPILWAGLEFQGVIGLAKATIIAPLVCLPVLYNEIRQAVTLPLSAFFALFWRPVIGASLMYFVVKGLHNPEVPWAILRLAQDVVVGVLSFTVTSALLWWLAGQPRGAESFLLGKLREIQKMYVRIRV
ncbi:MAG: oligosaccharide flippase family protein [Halioglobus sp.]|nr:oligosaccharide flippase family protein [Halioglobus sp.]